MSLIRWCEYLYLLLLHSCNFVLVFKQSRLKEMVLSSGLEPACLRELHCTLEVITNVVKYSCLVTWVFLPCISWDELLISIYVWHESCSRLVRLGIFQGNITLGSSLYSWTSNLGLFAALCVWIQDVQQGPPEDSRIHWHLSKLKIQVIPQVGRRLSACPYCWYLLELFRPTQTSGY